MLCHFSTFYLMRKLNIFNLQVSFAKFYFGYKFSDLTFISVGFPFSSSLSCFDALIESVKFSCLSCICLKKKKVWLHVGLKTKMWGLKSCLQSLETISRFSWNRSFQTHDSSLGCQFELWGGGLGKVTNHPAVHLAELHRSWWRWMKVPPITAQ